jgi:hypothetical protein
MSLYPAASTRRTQEAVEICQVGTLEPVSLHHESHILIRFAEVQVAFQRLRPRVGFAGIYHFSEGVGCRGSLFRGDGRLQFPQLAGFVEAGDESHEWLLVLIGAITACRAVLSIDAIRHDGACLLGSLFPAS